MYEIVVIGGGVVGAAIAHGLRDLGPSLLLLDEGDTALRASRGNFGLIWVQGKGLGLAPYGSWTQRSAREWPAFAATLAQETGVDVALAQPGGLSVCLSREALDARAAMFARLFAQPGFERYDVDMLDRAALAQRLPNIGPDVVGGSFSSLDGHCNPLRLLRALHLALQANGVERRADHPVSTIESRSGRFALSTAHGVVEAKRIVLAAGLGNARLAPMVGLDAPVVPEKGQVVVLERARPFLSFPLDTLRQTAEGSVLLGDSKQSGGLDDDLDLGVAAAIARRALAIVPALRGLRVVRAWAALRVMTPDGFPVYAESTSCPGAFVVTGHSGVTLAAAHSRVLAPAIRTGGFPPELHAFDAARFRDVRAAA